MAPVPANVDAPVQSGARPVFVDETGRRAARVVIAGLVVGLVLLAYVVAVCVALLTPDVTSSGLVRLPGHAAPRVAGTNG